MDLGSTTEVALLLSADATNPVIRIIITTVMISAQNVFIIVIAIYA